MTLADQIRRAAARRDAAELEVRKLSVLAVNQGASLRAVADCAGVSYTTIRHWHSGKVTPPDRTRRGTLDDLK